MSVNNDMRKRRSIFTTAWSLIVLTAFFGTPIAVIVVLYNYLNPLPAGETRFDAEVRVRNAEVRRRLCHLKSMCFEYASARQACATAGNFDNCIMVKMGDDYFSSKDLCLFDGKPSSNLNEMPNEFQCSYQRMIYDPIVGTPKGRN